jgi:hypothetical protein
VFFLFCGYVADPTCVFRGGAICIWHVKPHDRAQQRMRAVLRPVAGSANACVRLRSRGAPEAQHQMQSTLLLNVVTRQRAAIFQLFACEDQALLVPRGSVRCEKITDLVCGITRTPGTGARSWPHGDHTSARDPTTQRGTHPNAGAHNPGQHPEAGRTLCQGLAYIVHGVMQRVAE